MILANSYQRKIESLTAFVNNNLGEFIDNFATSVQMLTKSRDLLHVALKGQAFRPYNSTGKHLTFNKYIISAYLIKYGIK